VFRLGLEDAVPDHSTFSKNRLGRFRESEAFRHVFESVVERCIAEGLVGGEGFAIDASVIKADANRSRKTTGDEPVDLRDPRHATRAVREYLAALDAQGEPSTPPAAISRAVARIDRIQRQRSRPVFAIVHVRPRLWGC
jgi:hypothetical protein